jgi:hypothetical protein
VICVRGLLPGPLEGDFRRLTEHAAVLPGEVRVIGVLESCRQRGEVSVGRAKQGRRRVLEPPAFESHFGVMPIWERTSRSRLRGETPRRAARSAARVRPESSSARRHALLTSRPRSSTPAASGRSQARSICASSRWSYVTPVMIRCTGPVGAVGSGWLELTRATGSVVVSRGPAGGRNRMPTTQDVPAERG